MTDRTIQTDAVTVIRKVVSNTPTVVVRPEDSVQVVGCDQIILKTSYNGPQGPPGNIDDLVLPNLKDRFLSRLS